MPHKYAARFCRKCGERRRHSQKTPSHVLHLLLTVFTAGLWLLIWVLVLSLREPWHCTKCGTKYNRTRARKAHGNVKAARAAAAAEKKCPYCAETIKAQAIKCKHCGSELPNDARTAV